MEFLRFKLVTTFLVFSISFLSSQEIILGNHYSEKDVGLLTGYEIAHSITIEDRQVAILALPTAQNRVVEYEAIKIAVLKDSNGNFLDSIGILLEDNSFRPSYIDDNTALQNKIIFGFVYINQHSNNIEFYKALDKNSFIGSVVLSDDYIIFTTDLGPNLAKISLKTREITLYDTSVSGKLYAFDTAPYIALLEQSIEYNRVTERKTILDEPKQYLITETDVIPATKNYEVREAQKLIDFRSW